MLLSEMSEATLQDMQMAHKPGSVAYDLIEEILRLRAILDKVDPEHFHFERPVPPRFDVQLIGYVGTRINAMRDLRDLSGEGLTEIKAMLDRAAKHHPIQLFEAPEWQAKSLAERYPNLKFDLIKVG